MLLILNILETVVEKTTGNSSSNNTPKNGSTSKTREQVRRYESNNHHSSNKRNSSSNFTGKPHKTEYQVNPRIFEGLDILDVKEISTDYTSLSSIQQSIIDDFYSDYC